jgi:serine protease Do
MDRPIGHGSTFRIDPWGSCITAFHVIEEMLEYDSVQPSYAKLKPNIRLAALEIEGIGYGTCPIPKDAWRPLSGLNAPCSIETKPFELPQIINTCEIASMRIEHSKRSADATKFLRVDLNRWHPRIGDLVVALGFADLDKADDDAPDDRAFKQYLYGSFGRITDIERPDGSRKRAWPLFRVDAHWPGGMSGGPVFNEAGHVIGLVSAGFHDKTASAMYFSGWSISKTYMPSIDPDNPGWLSGYAVLNEKDDVVKFWPYHQTLANWATVQKLRSPIKVTYDPESRGWVSL